MEIIHKIASEINAIGGRCFYVGGYVRDKFLGYQSNDIDIEVFHLSITQLTSILEKFGSIETIGKSFGILKLSNYPKIDFALPRKEHKFGNLHTDFEIEINPNLSYYEAARRRDFTCNAIMEDILTGEILDYFSGITDIGNNILRYVDKTTFIEDALRGLRAAQFATRFNFSISNETSDLIKNLDYKHISIERIQTELQKGFYTNNTSQFFNILFSLNITQQLLPDIQRLAQQSRTKMQSMFNIIDNLNITSSTKGELKFSILILYLKNAENTLKVFISNKKLINRIKLLHENILKTPTIQSDFSIRHLKNKILSLNLYWQLLECITSVDPTFLPHSFSNFQSYKNYFLNVIKNNPSTIPLIQGRDLISLNFKPTKKFAYLLNLAQELEENGMSKNEIIEILKYEKNE